MSAVAPAHDDVTVTHHEAHTGDGWALSLRHTVSRTPDPFARVGPARPVLIVPGYGMNSHIFGVHPRGRSLEAQLAWRGLDVWSVDLRAQGRSRQVGTVAPSFGLAELSLVDVGVALDAVRAHTGSAQVDVIGASLGATLMLGHAAVNRDPHLGALVSFGGPLRWDEAHPALSLVSRVPGLVGRVPFRGTRALARLALPVLAKVPSVLGVYLNPAITDLTHVDELVATVEDPVPQVNREIAAWIRDRDLTLRGVNVTQGVGALANPLLCVVAMGDGIVPPETARSAYRASRASRRELLEVGDARTRIAHADLFISNGVQETVFDPVARWLVETP